MKTKKRVFFSPDDRKAIIFLLLIIILAAAGLFLLGKQGSTEETAGQVVQPEDSTRKYTSQYAQKHYQYDEAMPKRQLFPFDPNTADSTQLLALGLQPYQVKNIYKYRAKGGVYRQPSDFARLYGLTQKQYRELEPYIRISDDYRPAAELVKDSAKAPRDTVLYPTKLQPTEHLSLNSADTAALRKVPGIGRYYAREIDYRRKQLGGFVSTEQLKEIENFPEEALEYFTVDAGAVTKMNLNRLSLNQLKRHPYINFYQARAICDYRRLKGELKSIDDLRLLKEFSDDDITRLKPYV